MVVVTGLDQCGAALPSPDAAVSAVPVTPLSSASAPAVPLDPVVASAVLAAAPAVHLQYWNIASYCLASVAACHWSASPPQSSTACSAASETSLLPVEQRIL